jgi:hypothetical protein
MSDKDIIENKCITIAKQIKLNNDGLCNMLDYYAKKEKIVESIIDTQIRKLEAVL